MRNTKKNKRKYHGSYGYFKATKLLGNIAKFVIFLVACAVFAPLCPYVIVGAFIWWLINRKKD